jgi:hypothetical protein
MKKLLILTGAILGIANYGVAFETAVPEPAIPIVSVPHTISNPGTYYLATNITTSANAKITITASNVVLDLGGHTLSVCSTDACILIQGLTTEQPVTNVTLQNGALVNNVAACISLVRTNGCIIDHVSATSAGQCTLFDLLGANNRISNCIFVSGKPAEQQGPFGPHGPRPCTVSFEGCSDLLYGNIVTSPITLGINSTYSGSAFSAGGNALRNNVVRSDFPFPFPSSAAPPPPCVSLDQFDVYIGNLFPGKPAGATNVTGGVHATE